MFKNFSQSIIIKYLRSVGADEIPHIKSKTLLDHFVRVGDILTKWGCDQSTIQAGLCHSAYSTEAFSTAIIYEKKKSELEELIGEKSSTLVQHFSNIDRRSLKFNVATKRGVYTHRLTGETVIISEEITAGLTHLLLANEIDHITPLNFPEVESRIKLYGNLFGLLTSEAQRYLGTIVKAEKPDDNSFIKYIGHSSLWIKNSNMSLIVDPWFFSSSFKKPLLYGLKPGQKTIDFAIPKPKNSIYEIHPDVILLSHFHTHHSPLEEISFFASQKKIIIVCPPLSERELKTIREGMVESIFNNIEFIFVSSDKELLLDSYTVRCFTHTVPGHLGFQIQNQELTVMHITDAAANRDASNLHLDPLWDKLSIFPKTNHLFICAANHSQLTLSGDERHIREHASFSPVQASYLTRKINPHAVSLIGMSNFSIWDSLIEYTESLEDVSRHFSWAMRFLAPTIEVITLKPGATFSGKHYLDLKT